MVVPTNLYYGYSIMEKNNLATFYLACDHFGDMTQSILASNLVLISK